MPRRIEYYKGQILNNNTQAIYLEEREKRFKSRRALFRCGKCDTNFEAEITDNPLKNAFRGKATVHTHIPGQVYMGDEAISVIKNQYENKRQGTSLAYIHVPFCETRCLYCLFYQNPLRPESSQHYTNLLIKESLLETIKTPH